jgi:hypothetical protein
MNYIGVDPSYRKGGFWCCIIQGEFVGFRKIIDFIDWVTFIDSIADSAIDAVISIENSNETNSTFIAKEVRYPAAREKISRDVGKNQAISQMAVDYAKYKLHYLQIYSVSPAEKGMKLSPILIDSMFRTFGQQVKGYKGLVTEQDKRDAYKLAMQSRDKAIKLAARKKD